MRTRHPRTGAFKKTAGLLVLFCVGLAPVGHAWAGAGPPGLDDLTLITENYPPYSYEKNGQLRGFAVDLMVLMLEELGSRLKRKDIKLWPWARGYRTIREKRGTALFAISRTASREALFKWVGPIESNTISIMAHAKWPHTITSVHDFRRHGLAVAALIDDSGENVLLEAGVDPGLIFRAPTPTSLINLLVHGRYDLISYGELTTFWLLKEKGYNPRDYKAVYQFKDTPVFFAFNRQTPEPTVRAFQGALDKIKREGKYKAVVAKYLRVE